MLLGAYWTPSDVLTTHHQESSTLLSDLEVYTVLRPAKIRKTVGCWNVPMRSEFVGKTRSQWPTWSGGSAKDWSIRFAAILSVNHSIVREPQ